MTSYPEHLTMATAREHVDDLLREARDTHWRAELPRRHRVARYCPAWWSRYASANVRPATA